MQMLSGYFVNTTLYTVVRCVQLFSKHASRQYSLELPLGTAVHTVGTCPQHSAFGLSSMMSHKGFRLMTLGKTEARHYTTEPSPANTSPSMMSSTSSREGGYELVYRAPWNKQLAVGLGLTTVGGTAGVCGALFVPLYLVIGETLKSVGVLIGTGAMLIITHTLSKRYVKELHYNRSTEMIKLYTNSVIQDTINSFKLFSFKSTDRIEEFNISEAKPRATSDASGWFQVNGQPYFIYTHAFSDKQLLSKFGILHNSKQS